MASIVPYGGGWRAHLYVHGKRESEVFRTKREAKAWADRREAELRAAGAGAITLADAAERWLKQKLPSLDSAANQRTVEQSIRTHVLPRLGARPLAEVTRRELVDLVLGISESGRVELAQRIGQRLREIFDSAVDHGDIETHPAAGLARVLPKRRKGKMPAIEPADLPDLMQAIEGYSEPITRAGLLLLAHTFTRTTELIRATWDEIKDSETWVIPGPRIKQRLPHVVPLSRQVQDILADLRAFRTDGDLILPSPVNPMCGLSSNTLLYALYRLGYHGRMSGHGFRAVASTVLNESGLWNRDAIERQLSHGETDEVREAYNRAQYLEERRRMMSWWSDHLDDLAASTAS